MERRLAAILASDVVGYSKAMAADETGTLRRLQAHRAQLFDPTVSAHGGRIIKLMGDGALVAFDSVIDAVDCALAIQQALTEAVDDWPKLRIGINLGDVIVEGEDIYGDGVNLAARLEGLAVPGGICISDMVYQSVRNKAEVAFDDLGAQELKNIDRPVRVWQWPPADKMSQEAVRAPAEATTARSSIAVLPFNNMSGDPEQEYFSDGITEDIITELSRFREIFVIARNSAFAYKGKAMKVQEIGRDLGVAFIVEGSVRKSGTRVRVTAQLIEASSGNHIWAERYDRQLEDIFDLQDEITQTIVRQLPVRLQGALVESLRRKTSDSLSAYDCFLHGRWLFDQTGGQDPLALQRLKQAVEVDPDCAPAHAYIALAHAYSLYTVDPLGRDPLPVALESVGRALAVGEGDHFIHAAAGYVYLLAGRHDLADLHSKKAVDLNANDIFALMSRGYVLAYLGEAAAGVALLNSALEYDPHRPDYFHELFAEASYMLRDYEAAVAVYRRWQNAPPHTYCILAVNLGQLGRLDEAETAMQVFRDSGSSAPDFAFYTASHLKMCKRPEDAEHWREGYVKIGLLNR